MSLHYQSYIKSYNYDITKRVNRSCLSFQSEKQCSNISKLRKMDRDRAQMQCSAEKNIVQLCHFEKPYGKREIPWVKPEQQREAQNLLSLYEKNSKECDDLGVKPYVFRVIKHVSVITCSLFGMERTNIYVLAQYCRKFSTFFLYFFHANDMQHLSFQQFS